MDYAEKNLYAFYRYFGGATNVKLIIEKDYSAVLSENGSWPQMIFDLNQSFSPDENLKSMALGISKKSIPPFFVAPEKYISSEHSNVLKKYGFVPLKKLSGMNLNVHPQNDFSLSQEITFEELISDNLLNQYNNLINTDLLNKELPLDSTTLKGLKNSEVKQFGLLKNGKLISALLLCLLNNKGGLYFIVTRKEFQKQGYASSLIKSAINYSYNINLNELILHANQNSVELYKKIGFINQNRFIIYRKF
jgi:ribosomal protein S18 acetylase RimI-like enzyme